jgi:DNA ligase-1
MTFKPLLAATLEDVEKIIYPVFVSPKLDGLRCIIRGGEALSRNLKPFRNAHVQERLAGLPDGLDGELIVGSPRDGHVLNRTQSGCMSVEGQPDFKFYVFDNYLSPKGFGQRLQSLADIYHPMVEFVPHSVAYNPAGLKYFEQQFLDEGYEGLMIRRMDGPYKFGRSTLNEGILVKMKRFRDGEAVVIRIEEGVTNNNEATLDALGRTKRSNHQDNKVGAARVGTIIARCIETGAELQVSPGRMTHVDREFFWAHPSKLLGRTIKYKTFDYGTLDAPRFTTFQAFRYAGDMS